MIEAEGLEVEIAKLVAGGQGLAFHKGRAVFVPFALPGERLRIRIVEEHRDYLRAEILEILDASPDRVAPECPLYGNCGGCNLQHASYAAQLAAKIGIVRDIFRRGAGFDPGDPPIVVSEPFGYRNRLQFHFDPEGRPGFMRRNEEEVVAVDFCPIADPAVNEWLADQGGNARGGLREFLGDAERFLVYGAAGRLWLEGRHERVRVRVLGEELSFVLRGFFQSNLGLLGRLVEAALAGFEADGAAERRAADLYAGVGLFGHFLARSGARVTMVEQNAEALAEARRNVPGPAHHWFPLSVDEWCKGPGATSSFDFLIADPPRAGLSPGLRAWLARRGPPLLSYVSCDPVTLARDAKELLQAGYELEGLRLFDFYPQTSHVESLARFRRPRKA